ncbi:restriction endonuclease subunit S [Methylosinus sp. H3A]|uniref:restriction endonuclease subunit S n=1 Tax=Methylosinus sp. H3A TaxID=2785786 RepID=UPI0018C2A898|nr:restriction endonuclease subunit S [Methylosinus sp. H3A]MBG0810808.1 restriction endonuclease subunit S [Methylosinus sp. H3A]
MRQTNTILELADKAPHALNGGPFGSKLVSSMYVHKGVPVIRGINLPFDRRFNANDFVFVSQQKADELSAHIARPGDLVFTQRGTLGQIGLIPENGPYDRYVVSQSQMKLTVDPSMADSTFIYYYFRQPRIIAQIEALASSSGVPHINLQMLREFEVSLPSCDEQRRIADFLARFDDLIENNTRRIAILEDMARRIFEEWFVHFRAPGCEGLPLVESAIGPIPRGWTMATIKDVCDKVDYGYTAKATQENIGPKFLRITDIVPAAIDWSRVPYCSIPAKKAEQYSLSPGDIVIARTGATTGYAKHLGKRHPSAVFASYLVRLRITNISSNYYLGQVIESDKYKAFIARNVGGAAQPNANAQVLTSMPIILPPKRLLEQFDHIMEGFADLREILECANANLRAQRDLLLPKLIAGEIDVSAAATALKEAAE